MKKLITLIFVLTSLVSTSQESVSNYDMEYFGNKYNILSTEPDSKGEYSIYINAQALEGDNDVITINLDSKDLPKLKSIFNDVVSVYDKWSSTAKETGVSELTKEIESEKITLESSFNEVGKWYFDFNIKLEFIFKIMNGQNLLIIKNKNELVASSNKYIKYKGFYIVLNSKDEINSFLDSIDQRHVLDHYTDKKSVEDLFKQ